MAYNEKLAERIRARLEEIPKVEEKKMMGGLAFMVNGKMCLGIMKDELMCRINPDQREELLERTGCREMAFTGRPMKSMVLVEDSGLRSIKDFEFWMSKCLEYNKIAKRSKKAPKKRAKKK